MTTASTILMLRGRQQQAEGTGTGTGTDGRNRNNERYLTTYNAATVAESENDSGMNNIVNSAKEYTNAIKTGTTSIATTHPKEWTANQYLGVASGVIAIWSMILLACIFKGCCDKRRRIQRQKEDDVYIDMSMSENSNASEALQQRIQKSASSSYKYEMIRPHVVRGTTSNISSDDNLVTSYGDLDATDANRLPLGARLHGARKLRQDDLTGTGVRVAVIDSGIDHAHPGFNDAVRTKRWFRFGTPLSQDDHGTHVAGTIHFMAPDAEIFDYRVFGQDGDFDGDTAIAKSIRSAVDVDKCHVINMSLRCSYPVRPDVKKAIKYAKKKGVHMVCAAGNDGDGDPNTNELYSYPARFDETISVAAVRKEDGFPAAEFSESNPQVTYSGIGKDVVSLKPGGGIQTMSGTSMATPHVTGLIACLLSGNPTKYNDKQLRALLKNNYAVDIAQKGYDTQTGEGFVTYLAGDDEKTELFDLLSLVN